MPNKNWSILNSLQLGRYAEYFANMEFASFGLEVFSSEVDDRGSYLEGQDGPIFRNPGQVSQGCRICFCSKEQI